MVLQKKIENNEQDATENKFMLQYLCVTCVGGLNNNSICIAVSRCVSCSYFNKKASGYDFSLKNIL